MFRLSLVAMLPLVLVAGVAAAEIYRWTDERGQLHFAQSLDQVPARYRDQARSRDDSAGGGSFQTYEATGPAAAAVTTGRGHTFRIPFRREHSLMRVSALVNGHLDVPFYIDTGASSVSLPLYVAERLGIHVGPNTPHINVTTANGVIAVPLVKLESVTLGGARVDNLMATLNPTMNIGLLGGAFFNHFNYGVDPAASEITLVRNDTVQSGIGEDHWRRRFREVRGPLTELEEYLRNTEITRRGRRADLERRREELRRKLEDLELEANRDDVPPAWRR